MTLQNLYERTSDFSKSSVYAKFPNLTSFGGIYTVCSVHVADGSTGATRTISLQSWYSNVIPKKPVSIVYIKVKSFENRPMIVRMAKR